MNPRTPRLYTTLTLLLCLVVLSPHAIAQPATDPGETAYQEGRRLYDLREWDRAIGKFKEAYELRHDAASLFNIAQSYRLKGDCVEALGFYKTYSRNYPNAQNNDKVTKFISQLEPCAKQQTSTVKIEPVTAADSTTVAARPASPPTVPPSARGRHTLGLSIGGGGLAVIGAALVVGGLARSKWHDALAHCDANHACDDQGLALGDAARSRATISTVLGGVGIAAVAVGVVIYVTAPAESEKAVAVAPLAGPDRLGLVVEGRF